MKGIDVMFQIKPVQTKVDQERICALCNTEYDADMLAYSATTETGELLGICQFVMKDEAGYIKELVYAPGTDDFEAMFIMARATLNFIDLCGIKKAYYMGEEKPIVKAVGFIRDSEGRFFIDLTDAFEHKCGGKSK